MAGAPFFRGCFFCWGKIAIFAVVKIYPIFIVLISAIAAGCSGPKTHAPGELLDLYDQIDMEMGRSDQYQQQKEARIADLRRLYAASSTREERLPVLNRLIGEFESYKSDSALHYVNLALETAGGEAQARERLSLQIRKADIFSHAGLYSDALDLMRSLPKAQLDTALLEDYYFTYSNLYQYLCEYAADNEYAHEYERERGLYVDSVLSVAKPGSLNYLVMAAPKLTRAGRGKEGEEMLKSSLGNYRSGMREYSILASILAYIYNTEGNKDSYKKYLALSTISDIQGAVKENMAIRELSTALFEDGDIDRANRYLKKSFADANFYAARMRNAQSSRMLPVIDEAYAVKKNHLYRILRWQVTAISLLAAILVVALVLLNRQFRKVKESGEKESRVNAELQKVTEKLHEANRELALKNSQLNESSLIKEEYAGLFMEYCSSTISTLQHYHQSLKVMSLQGNRQALQKKLESSEMIDEVLKKFYEEFDEAIIHIYPHFVEKFNELLRPDERITLKPGELLNTELRVFALIRIGIEDSSKIAGFLRCSKTTVYTYRSKMRKRALNPDTFEEDVTRIGS